MDGHAGADQGDAVLIARVREGDEKACKDLRERHGRAAARLAGLLTDSSAAAAVGAAFTRVFEILRQGGGPSDAFRPFLLTTLRRELAGHRDEERDAFDPDVPFVDPALAGLEHRPVVRAYLSLPERWRAVLWHTAVEGERPARVLPLFGIGADGVTALAHRAREGLRQAYLRLYPVEERPQECRPVLDRIRVHLRGDLPGPENARIRRHLGACARCRIAATDLREMDGRLPEVAALVLGSAAAGYLASPGPGRSFRGVRAALMAWWWRATPGRRKQVPALGALAVVLAAALTAGVVVWPLNGSEPATRRERPGEVRVEAGSTAPPSRGSRTPRPSEPGRGPTTVPPEAHSTPSSPPSAHRSAGPRSGPLLEADIETAGVLLPGRTGIVVLTVRNAGNAPSGRIVADVALPRGVRPDGPADAGWSCLPAKRSLRCRHVPLAPGGGSSARLPVTVSPDAPTGASPAVRLAGSDTRRRASTGVNTTGLPARFVTEGRVRLTTAGNVLLSCPRREPACGTGHRRRGARLDNDHWDMSPLDLDAVPGTRTSSPATLYVPGRVRWAGLYWSGITHQNEQGSLRTRRTAAERHPTRGRVTAPSRDAARRGGIDLAKALDDGRDADRGEGFGPARALDDGRDVDRGEGFGLAKALGYGRDVDRGEGLSPMRALGHGWGAEREGGFGPARALGYGWDVAREGGFGPPRAPGHGRDAERWEDLGPAKALGYGRGADRGGGLGPAVALDRGRDAVRGRSVVPAGDVGRGRAETVRLRGPGGRYRTVGADRVDQVELEGRGVYQAFAEVTEQVRAGGSGRWWAADAAGLGGVGAYAGWSLVVVADDPRAEPVRTVVLDGARPVGGGGVTRARFPLGGLPRGSAARIGMLAWEGDAARSGDRVLLDGEPLSPPNAFTGALSGSGRVPVLGMDVVTYDTELGGPSVLEVTSSDDAVVVGFITITTPSSR